MDEEKAQRVETAVKQEDERVVADLKERMDALSDMEVQKDLIIADRETLKQQQIPLDIQVKLDEIDAEFKQKIEAVDLVIKGAKDQLQALLKSYARPIKSKFYTYSYEDEVIWNTDALDGYAQEHPEILWMRTTKPKTRLTPKKAKI